MGNPTDIPKGKSKQLSVPKPGIYIAGPLFSKGERTFNVFVRDLLRPFFSTYLPQEDGILLSEAIEDEQGSEVLDSVVETIFTSDLLAIRHADVLLAILDGRTVDEGTAFEIGFAYAIDKSCYGLQTDPRRLLPQGNNPMISRSLKRIFSNLEELEAWAGEYQLQSLSPQGSRRRRK